MVNCGNQYFRGDLHIHSCASKDYGNNQHDSSCIIDHDVLNDPKRFLSKLKESGLSFAAITDHNQITHLKDYIETARDIDDFVLFPGIELHVQGGRRGLHFLAIFPEELPYEELVRIRDTLGLTKDEGDNAYVIEKTPQALSQIVHDLNGILIAAHTDSDKGLTEDARGAQRPPMVNDPKLIAIEVRKSETADLFNGSDDFYTKKAVIQNSDAHCLCELGKTATCYKMEEVNFNCLREALLDHEMRIKLQFEIPVYPDSFIGRIKINTGFLKDLEIDLNPGLNCIIGARGAGKSVLIETIRFVMSEYKDDKEDDLREMMLKVLGNERAEVYFQVGGKNYIAGRDFDTNTSFRNLETRTAVLPGELDFSPRIFSQKELNQIASSPKDLRDLLDNSIPNIDKFNEDIAYKKSELEDNRISIRTLADNIPDKDELQNSYEELQKKLELYTKEEYELFHRLKSLRHQEKELVHNLINSIQHEAERSDIEAAFYSNDTVVQLMSRTFIEKFENSQNLEFIKKINAALSKFKQEKTHPQNENRRIIFNELLSTINEVNTELLTNHKKQEQEWQEFKKALSGGAEEELRSYEDYVTQLKQIEARIEEIEQMEQSTVTLLLKREDLISDLVSLVNSRSITRTKKVSDLKSILSENLSLEITLNGDKTEWIEFLIQKLKEAKIQKRHAIIIAERMSPTQLFSESEENLKDTFKKFSEDVRNKLVAKLDPEFKMMLQEVALNDLIELKMKMKDGSWKPASSLSIGQRSTALLPLVMEESKFPLIIDQPEDDLDNTYVYETLIETIRRIKEKRQIILATHNPNIPVSGDADFVIYLESDDVKGQAKTTGSIDNKEIKDIVKDIMEGGTDAFLFRAKKYGYNIENE